MREGGRKVAGSFCGREREKKKKKQTPFASRKIE